MVRKKFYGVHRGRRTGVFTSWAECELQIAEFPGASYKKFNHRHEAEYYVEHGKVRDEEQTKQVLRKRNENYVPPRVTPNYNLEPIEIYTDGSAQRHPENEKCIFGGYAVYFTEDDCIKEPFHLPNPTNQRCELQAAIVGIREAYKRYPDDQEVVVCTDSKYTMYSATEWWEKREQRGQSVTGYVNYGLIRQLRDLVTKYPVSFFWVPGHSGVDKNEKVDKLAKQAAESSMESSINQLLAKRKKRQKKKKQTPTEPESE